MNFVGGIAAMESTVQFLVFSLATWVANGQITKGNFLWLKNWP